MTRAGLAFILLLSIPFVGWHVPIADAQDVDKDFTQLMAARSLKCKMGLGAFADWESGEPVIEIDRWTGDPVLYFDAINLKEGNARIVGNQGASDVTAFLTAGGLHLMEQTGVGNVVLTSVFAQKKKGGYVFVRSRHMGGGLLLLPSQYHGTCKIWE